MKIKIGIILCSFIIGMGNLNAQTDSLDYFNMSLEDLMNLEIVAVSKKAESSFDAPLSSSIITKEELINSGATTIEEAFRLVPGFIVREETNGNYDIHIRGNDNIPPGNFTFFSENSMSLIMIDGRKVFNNLNGGTFWETLPISITDVERIEIIRGASTALYGPNAVNGMVNIITKKSPDKTIAVDGSIQGGSASTLIGDFAVNTSSNDNKLKARISANYEKRDRFTTDYYSWLQGEYLPSSQQIDYTSPHNGVSGPNHPTYQDSVMAKDRLGVNASLNYELNEDIFFSIAGGLQNSKANTVFMESSVTPISVRESESYYFNALSNIYGLSIQVSGNFGTQDIAKANPIASEFDFGHLDFIAEYDYTLGDLTLRPGVSYQSIHYDDSPYVDKPGSGFLNGDSDLSNFAYYLRGDYKATEKLRFIAALRMDHYNKPNDAYFTYQLIGTFKPTEKHLLRGSYSKANRGPVMIDFYANYTEGSIERQQIIQYQGKEDMLLPTSHVIELGYRGQLSPKLQVDIEAFYSATEDFPSFEPTVEAPSAEKPYVHVIYQYDNISAKAVQMGTTASLLYAPNKQWNIRAFATVQKTELKDYDKKISPLIIDPANGLFINPQYQRVTEEHKQTPSYFGGVTANYRPIEKLNIFAGLNFISEQEYRHDYALYGELTGMGSGATTVNAKALLNAKISYKFYKNNSVFVNARNLSGSSEREFGFADQTSALYLLGLNINL
ncbi:TonB-dependent receptor plug domain-containing protein [Carboxylicivirga sp. N1Y90]|uniref:TonB-dependent receptor plug domain-containing protein n=1 Tax=Carboxylicivirga fragile TaxID=3417571 RepID=UPI003D3443F5|nr:TonB-dependent receptor [Marinilabiliaceae bacterium N1Y90]